MTDQFTTIPLRQMLEILLSQYDKTGLIFGIPSQLFFRPRPDDPFRCWRYGQLLETPVGVAAGPHTQLTQNIVAAWLTGARFIELKTIQTLDELQVSKPCIDMQDEGYNCEWSQELKIHQSFDQYLNAWIILHILKHKFGWGNSGEPGFIFNMSVGYNLEGILKENVQWFFNKMEDASAELEEKIASISDIYPEISNISIPSKISDNITLSTMHGCPPDEIEKIGHYLLTEKKLQTAIKLNPTLLGKETLLKIMKASGFQTQIPEIAFEHDLKYPDALTLVKNLRNTAQKEGLHFSIKLTNTLESLNHKEVFPANEAMMYMSGRALHPVSVNLAAKLQQDFDGNLDISFSGGADAFNISALLAAGLSPETVCSDLLKPGGYGRMSQYLAEIRKEMQALQAGNLHDFILKSNKSGATGLNIAAKENLASYARSILENPDFLKTEIRDPSIKTSRKLGYFDCIHAPCVDTCPTNQDIPDYIFETSQGNFAQAGQIILKTNPFPHSTGMICDHLCQTKCTRINYDKPVMIREIKHFVAEKALAENPLSSDFSTKNGLKAAIIGAGPSGLSCAYFLKKAGFEVSVFEQKKQPGGMVSGAIPAFRLTDEAIGKDIGMIRQMGVEIFSDQNIDKPEFEKIRTENDFVYIATGAQLSKKLTVEGADAAGVLDPLDFLMNIKAEKNAGIGDQVLIIGGGNTAMDAARTAWRLVGKSGKVTVVYRRTMKEMPADQGEIKAVVEEGVEILEKAAPVEVLTENGKVTGLRCVKISLEGKDASGRPKPVEIPGSEFTILADTIIPALGQDLDIHFVEPELLRSKPGVYETSLENVFIGGDALRGASTAINAIGDGRKAAVKIIEKAGLEASPFSAKKAQKFGLEEHLVKRAFRKKPTQIPEIPVDGRKNFRLVTSGLTQEEIVREANRCLACDEVCNICTTVCPNLAFHSYEIEPVKMDLQRVENSGDGYKISEDGTFEVTQNRQILHLADWCNACGNCTTFCPSADSPYKEKPHLYLTRQSFEKENDGFYFENSHEKTIFYKNGDLEMRLQEKDGEYVFQENSVKIHLDKQSFRIKRVENPDNLIGEISIRDVLPLKIVMNGAVSFFGF